MRVSSHNDPIIQMWLGQLGVYTGKPGNEAGYNHRKL